MEYDALKVLLKPVGEGEYYVHATAPSGAVTGTFRLPFDERDLKIFVLGVRPRGGMRGLSSPEMGAAKTFGSDLFEALFREDVRDLYHSSSAEADSCGKGLRITLVLSQAPELMSVPWEYLCDDGRFLSVSERTPIVRYLELKRAHAPYVVDPPLRIVGMVSSPTDWPRLDIQEEKRRLEMALSPLMRASLVKIVWLETATLEALLETLESDDFHIFHYIGHGDFDEKSGGVLVLEDDRGLGMPVSGDYLGQLLTDERTLQLAVLNACEGARQDDRDPFGGVAASLVKNEIPSVVAMQFEISDDAAIRFAGGFYGALARGSPVDAALASARKAIWAAYNPVEWGTPVLFMRIPDGKVFDIHLEAGQTEKAEPDVQGLDVDLSADPPTVIQGEEVLWRLGIENRGTAGVSELSALRSDGTEIETGSELEPGRRREVSWRSKPEADFETTVTVSARASRGDRIVEQVSALVTVQVGGKKLERVPFRVSALALAGSLLLLLGIFFPWDQADRSWVDQQFVVQVPPHTGILLALSASAVAAGALGALFLAQHPRTRALASGLLIGFGSAGAVKYLGVLGHAIKGDRPESGLVFLAVFAGACLVVAAGVQLAGGARAILGKLREAPSWRGAVLLVASAVLIVVATNVRFNGKAKRSVIPDEGWLAVDPIAVALAVLALAFAAWRYRSTVLAGILIAIGIESAALWLRYIVVPILVKGGYGSFAWGGVVGLLGAALVLGTGVYLWRQDALRQQPLSSDWVLSS